jgi:hypothetical protein
MKIAHDGTDLAAARWNRGQDEIEAIRRFNKIKLYALAAIGFGFGFSLFGWAVNSILTITQ